MELVVVVGGANAQERSLVVGGAGGLISTSLSPYPVASRSEFRELQWLHRIGGFDGFKSRLFSHFQDVHSVQRLVFNDEDVRPVS